MARLILFIVLAGIILPAWTQGKSFLRVESGTHTAVISNLMVTSDGKYLVSAADDKTIRIWDIAAGKESRRILGYIGNGPDGAIHATALSADDSYLAVVVHRGETHNKRGTGDDAKDVIRLYDFASGRLIKVLQPNNTDDIMSVSFSEDGVYMVSGSEDHSIHVWEMSSVLGAATPQPKHTIREPSYIRRPYGLSIFSHGDDYRIVSADYSEHQHEIAIYSMKQQKILNSFKDEDRLLYVAKSDRYIAVCGYKHHILLFDLDLNRIKTIPTKTRPAGLAFSPDGKLLLAGAKETTREHPQYANIYDVEAGFEKVVTYSKHDAEARAVAFLDNNTAVTGGGSRNEIHFWNARSGQSESKLSGVGRSVFAVGIKDNKIAFGNTQAYKLDQNNYAPLEKIFDLTEFEPHMDMSGENAADYARAKTSWREQTLSIDADSGWDLFLHTQEYDYPVVRTGWYFHEAFGFTEDGLIASAGRGAEVRVYGLPPDGYFAATLADFVGHTSRVWDLAVQGNWLVTGSVDQTIKLWNLAELERDEPVIYPMLNLFVSTEGEWVIWSKSGYYDASVRGDQYIGYHVNQAEDEAALFYTSDRFLKTLYRPDLIRLILQTGSEEEALRLTRLETKHVDEILPPKIELHSSATVNTGQGKTTVEFSVSPEQDAVTRIWILQNGKLVWSKENEPVARGGRFSEPIALLPGENRLEIFAESKVARSSAALVNVTVDDSEWQARGRFSEQVEVKMKEEKPNLYVLAIGVSQYENAGPNLKNLNYAHKDAIEFQKAFQAQNGKTYNDVITRLVVNEAANKAAIEAGFSWLKAEAEKRDAHKRANNILSEDISLVFLAGHGLKEGEDFFFLGHDADLNNLGMTGVKLMDQGDILSSLPTDVILITDACHAGTVGGGVFKNLDSRELSKRLVALNERAIYILNATKSDKPSLESSAMQHGVFTMVMLEGLQREQEVYIQPFISFVKRNVKKRTKDAPSGAQEPHVVHYGEYEDYLIHSR